MNVNRHWANILIARWARNRRHCRKMKPAYLPACIMSDVPAPDSVPPLNNPEPQPGDPKPKAPPAQDEPGRRTVPVELPGQPHPPERA
jgi:hypothetical protein